MKLIPNAGRVALRAHSMWANYLGVLCLIIPELIYWLFERDTNPRTWWWLGIALILYGVIGRIKDQGIVRSPVAVLIFAVLMSIAPEPPAAQQTGPEVTEAQFVHVATPFVAKWEGKRNKAYRDIGGVWTVCYGETRGVRPGDTYTDAECHAMLQAGLLEYRAGLHGYFNNDTINLRLTPHRDAAYVSLAYNVGIRGAGKSTATRRLNAGDIAGGCQALGWWNKAGGRVVRGLVNRRAEETQLCMQGLA